MAPEDRTRPQRNRTLIAVAGAAVSSAATAIAIMMVLGLSVQLVEGGGIRFGPGLPATWLALFAAATIYAATIGLLVHIRLCRRKWLKATTYALVNLLTGLVLVSVLLTPLAISGSRIYDTPIALLVGVFVYPAAIVICSASGLVFWLIRRPDRDAPPNPPTSAP